MRQELRREREQHVEALRAAVIREHARRFGGCPPRIEEAINRIADSARLVELTFVFASGTRRNTAQALTKQ